MVSSQKIGEFLQLEDTDEILRFRTDSGRLIWPSIRYLILSQLYNEEFGLAELSSKQRLGIKQIKKFLMLFVAHSPFWVLLNRKIENLFFYSSVSNFKANGVFVNRVADYLFFTQKHNSYCLETLYNKELNYPRAHNRIAYAVGLNAICKLLVKVGLVRNSGNELENVTKLFALLNARSDHRYSAILQRVFRNAVNGLALAKAQYAVYDLFFKLSSIKRLILEDAAYGGTSFIQFAARKNGITIIEPQHGAITTEHLGYNFGSSIARSVEYKRYLPDYFLSFGRYWHEQVNLPVAMVPIGNPYLSEYLKNCTLTDAQGAKSILVISPGTAKEETEVVTSRLIRHFSHQYRIVLRPHPLEKFEAAEKYRGLIEQGAVLDANQKVYDSIQQAECIVGDISTVLFEAVAFNKIVVSYNSKINPPISFPANLVYRTEPDQIAETVETLLKDQNRPASSDLTYVWESDWQARFATFLQQT